MEKPTCSIDDCDRDIYRRSLCGSHYGKARRQGLPMPPRKQIAATATIEERLAHHGWLVTRSGCWEWQGARHAAGYGAFGVGKEVILAHRAMYASHFGDIPKGMLVRHKCDNPPCVNPEHLELGNNLENSHDKRDRLRDKSYRAKHWGGMCAAGTHEIRSVDDLVLKRASGRNPFYQCRQCRREWNLAYKARNEK